MKTYLILLFSLLMVSCASLKKTGSVDNFDAVYFGSGGGFTGIINTFMIDSEGYVYKANGEEKTEIKRLKYKTLKRISKQIEKINLKEIDSQDTGNMTYFIDLQSGDEQHKVTWSDASDQPELKSLYTCLFETLK